MFFTNQSEAYVFISDEEQSNMLIGQAAMQLLLRSQDVNVQTLQKEMLTMAETEHDEQRLVLMHETRRWLAGYCSLSSRTPERAGWLEGKLPGEFHFAVTPEPHAKK
ncbi:hypothetical protein RIN58_08600 [Siccibacter colletis]|uniref:hypothetical protein n=1 Tax=Siccibacter colletis TaxID=1505757 RepID=UPI0028BE041F|nr:hypothetical protein [Siccibacter colletis]WNN50132.1 hypothetical protein RIN58_08600 [Siccibacter colletis]